MRRIMRKISERKYRLQNRYLIDIYTIHENMVLRNNKKSQALAWDFDYFHLRRVMAKLQHMCLCECDHPPQIKTIAILYHVYLP